MPKLKVDGIEVEGDAAAWPIQGLIRHFRPEIERRITQRQGGEFAPMQEAAE